MRKWIDQINEGILTLEQLPLITLAKGTLLYHGTDAADDFNSITLPHAWFTEKPKGAEQWAGWTTYPESSHKSGERRVLVFRLKRDVHLFDLTKARNWTALCMATLGQCDDVSLPELVKSIRGKADGWISRGREAEVMILMPSKRLEHVETKPVKKGTVSANGTTNR